MLEAVYVDLAASRSIVGLQPKAPFYPLFDSLKQMPGNKVIIFRPGEVQERTTGSVLNTEPDFGLVETGETRSPSYQKVLCVLRDRGALAVSFAGSAEL